MKKIIITVVIVLLILGAIGGSFAIANHFKKPEEQPAEQEKVFQNAVLENGTKVEKLYFNPDFKLVSTGGDGVFNIDVLSRQTFGILIDSTNETMTDEEITNYYSSNSNIDNLSTARNSGIPGYFHFDNQSYGQNLIFGFNHAATNKHLEFAYCFDMVSDKTKKDFGIIGDLTIPYNFNMEELSITFDKPYMLMIKPDLFKNLVEFNIISEKPFYILKDKVTDDTLVEEASKTSESAVLSTQQVINKLYINPNFDYKNYVAECNNDSTLVMGTPLGIFVKKGLENTTYTNDQLSEIFATEQSAKQFVTSNCNGDHKTMSIEYCGMAKGAISISLKDGEWGSSVMFRDKSIDVSNSSSNVFSKKSVSIENGTISLGQDYILILNPKYLKALVNSNCISTIPYPAVA